MRLNFFQPHPLLKDYIDKIFVLDSDGRIADDDLKLIVPNGLPKIVIPIRNGLSSKVNGIYQVSQETTITLIGMSDISAIVEAESVGAHSTLCIEFSAVGAYRFFRFDLHEMSNRVLPLMEVLDRHAGQLQEEVSNAGSVAERIDLLQGFLLQQLQNREDDPLLNFCLRRILSRRGSIAVHELEKATGYSSRWLHMKFLEKVGISPKSYASVIRFQPFYKAYTQRPDKRLADAEFYNYFYDQSHFIKDFKRYTGLAPTKFMKFENEYGRIFYKD
jgi:AraC-like DNA-binding protein